MTTKYKENCRYVVQWTDGDGARLYGLADSFVVREGALLSSLDAPYTVNYQLTATGSETVRLACIIV
jgi:hypothetical protein